jgi:hypothetical protein
VRRSITTSPREGATVILRSRRISGPQAAEAAQVPVQLAA